MTPARSKFAHAVASGKSYADAYREAFPGSSKWKPSALHKRASELARDPEVTRMVDELRAAADEAATVQLREARLMLSERAREIYRNGGKILDLVRALDALSRLCAWGATAHREADAVFDETPVPFEETSVWPYLTEAEREAVHRRRVRRELGLEDEDADGDDWTSPREIADEDADGSGVAGLA